MRKKPKALGLNEPFRHHDHPRPTTRREFVAQGFIDRGGHRLGPSLRLLAIRARRAPRWRPTFSSAVTACGITTGAGKIPFICFDLAGGGNIAGSNVLVGGPKGQLDFLSRRRLQQTGAARHHGAQCQRRRQLHRQHLRSALPFDSAHLRGIKTRASAKAMANTNGTVIPALSQNDTNTNPHNPMYGIWQYGARGGLLDLIGSESSMSGGNSMAPPTMIIAARAARQGFEFRRYARAWSAPDSSARCCPIRADVHQRHGVDEAHQRCEVRHGAGLHGSVPKQRANTAALEQGPRPAATPRRPTSSTRTTVPAVDPDVGSASSWVRAAYSAPPNIRAIRTTRRPPRS